MKKIALWISGVAVVAAVAGTAVAQAPLTDTLKEKVAAMSPAQQEALLGLIEAISGGEAAPAVAAADSAIDALDPNDESTWMPALQESISIIKQAAKDEDVDAVMGLIHDDFEHYQVGGKEDLRDFLQNAIDMGYVSMYAEDIEIYTDDTEFEEDGEEVIIYPIDVELPIASVTLEFVVAPAGDTYKIVTLDVSGI